MESYLLFVEVGSKSSEWESGKGAGWGERLWLMLSRRAKLRSHLWFWILIWYSNSAKLTSCLSPVYGIKRNATVQNFHKIIKRKIKALLIYRLMANLLYTLSSLKAQTNRSKRVKKSSQSVTLSYSFSEWNLLPIPSKACSTSMSMDFYHSKKTNAIHLTRNDLQLCFKTLLWYAERFPEGSWVSVGFNLSRPNNKHLLAGKSGIE